MYCCKLDRKIGKVSKPVYSRSNFYSFKGYEISSSVVMIDYKQ